MQIIWDFTGRMRFPARMRTRMFLFLNISAFLMMGLLAWLLIETVTDLNLQWLICFLGYPGYFIGYIGGLFFVMKKDAPL